MGQKILLIDDDISILEIMRIILEEYGYQVTAESNCGLVEEKISLVQPDLILMDIWMAQKNGNEIARSLKAQESTKHIPLILVSANNDTAVLAREAGADDFLAKPFDITDLLAKVQKFT